MFMKLKFMKVSRVKCCLGIGVTGYLRGFLKQEGVIFSRETLALSDKLMQSSMVGWNKIDVPISKVHHSLSNQNGHRSSSLL